jgi:hypothetical protein
LHKDLNIGKMMLLNTIKNKYISTLKKTNKMNSESNYFIHLDILMYVKILPIMLTLMNALTLYTFHLIKKMKIFLKSKHSLEIIFSMKPLEKSEN